MLGIVFRVVALILFLVAGVNQTLFNQGPADLIAFGLASWVLGTLLDGVAFGSGGFHRNINP